MKNNNDKIDSNMILLLGLLIIFFITFILPNLNTRLLNLLTRPFILLILFMLAVYISNISLPIGIILVIGLTTLIHYKHQRNLQIDGYQNSIENFLGGYDSKLYQHGKVCDISPEDIDSTTILKPENAFSSNISSDSLNNLNNLNHNSSVDFEPLEIEKIQSEYEQPLSNVNLINNSTSAVLPNIYMPENNDSDIPGFNYNNYGDLHVKNYPI